MSLYVIKNIFKRLRLIVLGGILCALIAVGLSFLLPFEYRADAQVLIISQSRYGVDPYTVVKSAERIGENIVQIIKTDDFFSKVIEQSNGSIDIAQFQNISEQDKRKKWKEMLAPSVVYGTGLLNISAFHTDPEEARDIAAVTVETLKNRGWEYIGGDVIIREVNPPIVSKFPARPNMLLNGLFGFFIGIILATVIVIQQANKKHVVHKW